MRTSTNHALLTLAAWTALGTAGARAQDQEAGAMQQEAAVTPAEKATEVSGPAIGNLRLYGGMRMGLGGNFTLYPDAGGNLSDDLKATVGIQAGVDYVVMRFFAIAGEFRLGWWNYDAADEVGAGRSLAVDIDVKPRGLYMFKDLPLEVYGTIPIGLTIPSLDGDLDLDSSLGWNIGFGAGATWFFTEHMGANLEMLGLLQYFGADIKGPPKVNADSRLGQFNIFANVVYAL